jgi:hypothetical protein
MRQRPSCSIRSFLVAALVAAGPAWADSGGASPSPSAAAPPAAAPAKPDSLDFDLLDKGVPAAVDPAAAAKAEALRRKTHTRRLMLQLHQGLGFAMLAAMAATVVIGHLEYVDKYGGGPDDGRYNAAHEGLAIATTALFATVGALGLFAPNPYPKPIRFDTALVHKTSMILATAGMLAQIIMGPIVAAREGKLDQPTLAAAHLGLGYATLGFTTIGVVAYVF